MTKMKKNIEDALSCVVNLGIGIPTIIENRRA